MTDTEKQTKKAERKAYKKRRRAMIDKHRIHFAVYHCLYVSELIPDIAAAVAVEPQKIAEWAETDQWKTSGHFFLNQELEVVPAWDEFEREQLRNERKSLSSAKGKWKYLIKEAQHIKLDSTFTLLTEEHTPEFVWDTQSLSLIDWELPVETTETHWVWQTMHRAIFVLLTMPVSFSATGGEG